MGEPAYYWIDYDLHGYIRAAGVFKSDEDAINDLLSYPPGGRFRLTPWYPATLAPDALVRRMGEAWHPSFDVAVVIEILFDRPLGYLIRSPSQTLDPE